MFKILIYGFRNRTQSVAAQVSNALGQIYSSGGSGEISIVTAGGYNGLDNYLCVCGSNAKEASDLACALQNRLASFDWRYAVTE
jgi:hypothetical protein